MHFLQQLAHSQPERIIPFPQNTFLVHHPDHVKYVLQDNYRNYARRPLLESALGLIGDGLVTSEGDLWMRQRRLMQPAFHRQKLAALTASMCRVTQSLVAEWCELAEQEPIIDVFTAMKHLTMRITVDALFSFRLGEETIAVGEAFQRVTNAIRQRMIGAGEPQSAEETTAMQALDDIVYDIIHERRTNPQPKNDLLDNDLLDMLLDAHDAESGDPMSAKQLRDEIMTLFVAGHETTTDGLCAAWYLLATYPDFAEQISAELAQLPPTMSISFDTLHRLPVTMMVVQEVLRFYPPVGIFGRKSLAPDQIGDQTIPADATILLSPYVTHRHPHFWESAETFDPTRFTPERTNDRPRYAYLPFSRGPRQCIGNHFALIEMQIAIAHILQHFRLTFPDGERSPFHHGSSLMMRLSRNA